MNVMNMMSMVNLILLQHRKHSRRLAQFETQTEYSRLMRFRRYESMNWKLNEHEFRIICH